MRSRREKSRRRIRNLTTLRSIGIQPCEQKHYAKLQTIVAVDEIFKAITQQYAKAQTGSD